MCVCVCVCVCVIKISGNIYKVFNGNILFFIDRRTSSNKIFFVFFYILAIEEIDKIMVKM